MDAITFTRCTETRALIVDDELHARKLLATMLGEGGVRCKTAACAEEALRILDGDPLDAMLVDLQMPGRFLSIRRRIPAARCTLLLHGAAAPPGTSSSISLAVAADPACVLLRSVDRR